MKQNELISTKYKNFILASRVTGYVSISDFAILIGVPVGIASSAVEIKICAINAVIRKYKSIIKIIIKKRNKIVSLAKTKLNTIEVLFLKL